MWLHLFRNQKILLNSHLTNSWGRYSHTRPRSEDHLEKLRREPSKLSISHQVVSVEDSEDDHVVEEEEETTYNVITVNILAMSRTIVGSRTSK